MAYGAALAVAASAIAPACTDATTTTATPDDAGLSDGGATRGVCPNAEPKEGAACLLPEGTTCDFGACRFAACVAGAWRFGSNDTARPPCPEVPPSEGQACPACWPASASCTYGSTDCSAADASVNTAFATCPSGAWVLDIRPCRDGGADVQGDSGDDAD